MRTLTTIDGHRLAADLAVPAGARAAVVALHPHPRYGGDRHNLVVDAIVEAAAAAGVASLRFDFRGVGNPAAHADGDGERLDVLAALDALAAAVPGAALVLVGYSFGAAVGLTVDDARVAGWVAVAPPLGSLGRPPVVGADPRPKLLLVPAHDQFCPPDAARRATEGWIATTLETVESADHFLAGASREVAGRVMAFSARQEYSAHQEHQGGS